MATVYGWLTFWCFVDTSALHWAVHNNVCVFAMHMWHWLCPASYLASFLVWCVCIPAIMIVVATMPRRRRRRLGRHPRWVRMMSFIFFSSSGMLWWWPFMALVFLLQAWATVYYVSVHFVLLDCNLGHDSDLGFSPFPLLCIYFEVHIFFFFFSKSPHLLTQKGVTYGAVC